MNFCFESVVLFCIENNQEQQFSVNGKILNSARNPVPESISAICIYLNQLIEILGGMNPLHPCYIYPCKSYERQAFDTKSKCLQRPLGNPRVQKLVYDVDNYSKPALKINLLSILKNVDKHGILEFLSFSKFKRKIECLYTVVIKTLYMVTK